MTTPLQLNYRSMGDPDAPPVILLHGLLGSANNWLGVARHLTDAYHVVMLDLRNHGASPHAKPMNYPAMVADVSALIQRLELENVSLVGHSMGGKVAMWLALTQPERVSRLAVVDIAPVSYDNRFKDIFAGLNALDLSILEDRNSADDQLSNWVSDRRVRQYLLQNLQKTQNGWRWRCNLDLIEGDLDVLMGFPEASDKSYQGGCMFIYGARSNYVTEDQFNRIRTLFPYARMRAIHGAGHWVYVDQAALFMNALTSFLK